MSSADHNIIKSVEGVISSITALEGEIRRAPDVDKDAKLQALEKVSVVAENLKQIHLALFADEVDPSLDPTLVSSLDPVVVTNLSRSLNDALSLMSGNVAGQNSKEDYSLQQSLLQPFEDETLEPEFSVPKFLLSDVDPEPAQELDRGVDEPDDQPNDALEPVLETEDRSDVLGDAKIGHDLDNVLKVQTAADTNSGLRLVMKPSPKKKDQPDQIVSDDEPAHSDVETVARTIEMPEANNLLLIDGIDEDVEDLLNRYDIFRFEEIAAFREADVVRVSDLLNDPFRVSRENWVEQAVLLAQDLPTKYSQRHLSNGFFDRLSWQSAYEAIGAPIETLIEVPALDDEAAFYNETSRGAIEEMAHMPSETILREKEILEAELASLRQELAARTTGAIGAVSELETSELETSELENSGLETDENFSHYQADGDEGDQALDLNIDLAIPHASEFEASDIIAREPDAKVSEEMVEGAMWHEEVSTSADYVPPIVDPSAEMPEGDAFYQGAEFGFEEASGTKGEEEDGLDEPEPLNMGMPHSEQDLEDQRLMDSSDIAVPHTRQRQDDYMNRVFDSEPSNERDEVVARESDLSGVPDNIPSLPPLLPGQMPGIFDQERPGVVAKLDGVDQEGVVEQRVLTQTGQPVEDRDEADTPSDMVTNGMMPLKDRELGDKGGALVDAPFTPPHGRDAVLNNAIQDGRRIDGPPALPQAGGVAPPPIMPPATTRRPYDEGASGHAPAPLRRVSQPMDGAPPLPVGGPPGVLPGAGAHVSGRPGIVPRGPMVAPPPLHKRQEMRDERIAHGGIGHDHNAHRHASASHRGRSGAEGPDLLDEGVRFKRQAPQVSDGFKLKARKFAESLQRSFVSKDD